MKHVLVCGVQAPKKPYCDEIDVTALAGAFRLKSN